MSLCRSVVLPLFVLTVHLCSNFVCLSRLCFCFCLLHLFSSVRSLFGLFLLMSPCLFVSLWLCGVFL